MVEAFSYAEKVATPEEHVVLKLGLGIAGVSWLFGGGGAELGRLGNDSISILSTYFDVF